MLACAATAGAAEPARDEELPEAFIEFLAEWGDEQGQVQDPLDYLDPQWQMLDPDAGQSDE